MMRGSNKNSFLQLLLLLCAVSSIECREFREDGYYPPGYYDSQQVPYDRIKLALDHLELAPKWVNDWPNSSVKFGQVSGVAVDNAGRLLVFHRANHVWDASTFYDTNVYQGIGSPPILEPTILVFNETGELVDSWGQGWYHIPHGITVDSEGNVWTTDVARHQVFKFTPTEKVVPALELGEKFVPGDDINRFCKPSAVAVLPSGEFFVADGYCNHRILKFAPDGTVILQWGRSHGDSPFTFNVPHALTLVPDRGLVCVADRERGRVACFQSSNGTFAGSYSSWLIGSRLFSVAYSAANGGRFYIVNGPSGQVPVRGYVIDFSTGRLIQTFAPEGGLHNPHDIAVSADGSAIYVAELSPYRVLKFVDESVGTEAPVEKNLTARVKPTATVEVVGRSRGAGGGAWWSGAVGGAAGAGGAALLALAAMALLRARNAGKPRHDQLQPLVS